MKLLDLHEGNDFTELRSEQIGLHVHSKINIQTFALVLVCFLYLENYKFISSKLVNQCIIYYVQQYVRVRQVCRLFIVFCNVRQNRTRADLFPSCKLSILVVFSSHFHSSYLQSICLQIVCFLSRPRHQVWITNHE